VQERGLRGGNLRDHGATFHRGIDLSLFLHGGADKSLARPNSRCPRTESIVSLERGDLFMCRIASLFLLQRLKGSISGDASDFNNMETLAVIKSPLPPARQGAEGNSRHSDRNMHRRMPPSKIGWPSLDG